MGKMQSARVLQHRKILTLRLATIAEFPTEEAGTSWETDKSTQLGEHFPSK